MRRAIDPELESIREPTGVATVGLHTSMAMQVHRLETRARDDDLVADALEKSRNSLSLDDSRVQQVRRASSGGQPLTGSRRERSRARRAGEILRGAIAALT
jgi:hypothetical protein